MKRFLLVFFILILAARAKAQTGGLQAGLATTFFINKGTSSGGELIGNIAVQEKLVIGAGLQLWKFKDVPKIYTPVFATVKYFFPAKKIIYFLHVDPGYGIYNYNYTNRIENPDESVNIIHKNTGGFYLGAGAGLSLKTKIAPYFNIQYSLYHFRYSTQYKDAKYLYKENPNTVTFSAGIWLHSKK